MQKKKRQKQQPPALWWWIIISHGHCRILFSSISQTSGPRKVESRSRCENQAGVSCVGADILLIACAEQEPKEAWEDVSWWNWAPGVSTPSRTIDPCIYGSINWNLYGRNALCISKHRTVMYCSCIDCQHANDIVTKNTLSSVSGQLWNQLMASEWTLHHSTTPCGRKIFTLVFHKVEFCIPIKLIELCQFSIELGEFSDIFHIWNLQLRLKHCLKHESKPGWQFSLPSATWHGFQKTVKLSVRFFWSKGNPPLNLKICLAYIRFFFWGGGGGKL